MIGPITSSAYVPPMPFEMESPQTSKINQKPLTAKNAEELTDKALETCDNLNLLPNQLNKLKEGAQQKQLVLANLVLSQQIANFGKPPEEKAGSKMGFDIDA